MMRHYVEKAVAGLLLLVSLGFAALQQWQPAGYFLFLAGFVDFDDWSRGK